VIGRRVPHPVDLLETASVDAAVTLGELPTTAWKREELVPSEDDETLVTRSGHMRAEAPGPAAPSPREHTDHTSQLATSPCTMLTVLSTTQRIPRDDLPGKTAVEFGEPLRPSPCVLVEPQSGVVIKPATLVRAKSDDDTVPAVSRSPRVHGTSPIPMQPAGPSGLVGTTPQALVSHECPAPIMESEIMDAEILARNGQLAERSAADSDAARGMRHTPPGPLSTFAAFRQRFAIRWGREPRVVATIALAAALSLSALVSQVARRWREMVEFASGGRDAGPVPPPASASRAQLGPEQLTHAR
jgi:hypothetical protein